MSGLLHGGDVAAFERQFPDAPRPTIDLSTGINPYAYPVGAAGQGTASRLPGHADQARVISAFATYAGARSANILPVPGSQAAISGLPLCSEKTSVGVVSPTYNEHGHSWRAAGHQVIEASLDECLAHAPKLLVLVNPNNPTGTLLSRAEIETLLGHQTRKEGYLIVDEAFIDVTPEASVSDLVSNGARLIVLRSFGKFFGLAGLRLGLCLAPCEINDRLQNLLGPWPIATPTLACAAVAYRDREWIAATRTRLQNEARRLRRLLNENGLEAMGGTDLFQTCRHAKRDDIVEGLGRAGIFVRSFPKEARWMRVGLPANEAAWQRLEALLADLNLKGDRHE